MARKILLVQLRQLGDIILTTPSLREIKKAWPDASIDFLTHPMGRLILQDNPYLSRHLVYDPKANWKETLALLRDLRKARYDLVLDFMYNPRSAFYSWISAAPCRLAFPSRRSMFFTETVPQGREVEYIVQEKFRYLHAIGIRPTDIQLDLPWSPHHCKALEGFLQTEPSFRDAPLRIVLSPTHRRKERQWPKERYAAIADRLLREWKASVVWIWGPGEEDFVKEAMSLCAEKTLLAPSTSFRELAAFMGNCDLFIGNSNGPSHVAVSTGIHSLQIHGPTYAKAWCPCTKRHRSVQAAVSTPEGRGPIDLISEGELWHALEDMRSSVEFAADLRRKKGLRTQWSSEE